MGDDGCHTKGICMMGIQLILVASLFIALSNYCMRRSIDAGGSSKGFLMIQLFLVFIVLISVLECSIILMYY